LYDVCLSVLHVRRQVQIIPAILSRSLSDIFLLLSGALKSYFVTCSCPPCAMVSLLRCHGVWSLSFQLLPASYSRTPAAHHNFCPRQILYTYGHVTLALFLHATIRRHAAAAVLFFSSASLPARPPNWERVPAAAESAPFWLLEQHATPQFTALRRLPASRRYWEVAGGGLCLAGKRGWRLPASNLEEACGPCEGSCCEPWTQ
jgi:hypothetical protein